MDYKPCCKLITADYVLQYTTSSIVRLQRLFVAWLERAKTQDHTTEPDWQTSKLVPQQYKEPGSNRKSMWTAIIDPATVVHGCVPKLRPKYSFPDRDQADFFVRAMVLIEQDRITELAALPRPLGDDDEEVVDLDDDDMDDIDE